MFVQKIKKSYVDEVEMAEKYYSIVSVLNDIPLTNRDIQLLAFLAVKGTLNSVSSRKEFCEKHNTSIATINNIISKLKKYKLVVKKENKWRVNEAISPKFENNLGLVLSLEHGNK